MQSEGSKQKSKYTYDRKTEEHNWEEKSTRLCTELYPPLSTGFPSRKPSTHRLENLALQKMKIAVLI